MNGIPVILLVLTILPIIPLLVYISGFKKLGAYTAIFGGIVEITCASLIINSYWNTDSEFSHSVLRLKDSNLIELGFWLNNNSLSLLLTVVLISILIRIYAYSYLKNDDRRDWFIVLVAFFTFSMNGIVLMPNLLAMFFFWEWVGLASYLMIGFWYSKPEAAQAAKKAFLYNKIGDLGFILALGIVYAHFGTFNIPEIIAFDSSLPESLGLWFGFGIFLAAIAKSAQLPFSVWLPDAMEGPTPASALIHSATMVTAGVYVLLRVFPLLPTLVTDVALYLGIVTVIWAGLAALTNTQLKKILAYSTISQLGFMMLGIGASYPQAAFFHLITHAFFKTSLFLCAGVIISIQAGILRETGSKNDSQDIRYMEGLWGEIPLLGVFLLISGFALAGVPFFSGFISKEAIVTALEGNAVVLIIALIGALLTALYSGRLIFSVFKFKSTEISINGFIHELKGNILQYAPILLLSFLSFGFVFSSWIPDFNSSWLLNSLTNKLPATDHHLLLTAVSVLIAIGGILIAFYRILKKEEDILNESSLFSDGLRVDASLKFVSLSMQSLSIQLAQWIEIKVIERIISFLTYSFVFTAMIARLLDQYVVDGSVRGVAFLSARAGDLTRNFQSGNLRNYLLWLIIFLLIGIYLISGL